MPWVAESTSRVKEASSTSLNLFVDTLLEDLLLTVAGWHAQLSMGRGHGGWILWHQSRFPQTNSPGAIGSDVKTCTILSIRHGSCKGFQVISCRPGSIQTSQVSVRLANRSLSYWGEATLWAGKGMFHLYFQHCLTGNVNFANEKFKSPI